MAYIHPRLLFSRRFLGNALLAFCLLALGLMMGCERDGGDPITSDSTPSNEFRNDIHNPVSEYKGKAWAYKFTAANLCYRGIGAGQRALIQDPDLRIIDHEGRLLLHISAQSGIALHPYKEISLRSFNLETQDSTTFDGEELVWPYAQSRDRIGLLGKTLIVMPKAVVEAETVIGDILMRGYEVVHVLSLLPLNAADSNHVDGE